MNRALPAAVIVCACLTLPAIGAGKKKPPTATPATILSPSSVDAAPSGTLISSEMSGKDLEFFTDAVDAGREQAFYIGLLKKSASSDQIKSLAEALGTTQEEENGHIAKLAALKGWNVSLEPTSEQRKAATDLEKLTGSNLDHAAMDKIVAASKKAMDAYQGAAQSTDKDIKIFAAQMLPLAEEKRHVVEKMTGAGNKTAARLFREGAAPDAPAATPARKDAPAATPVSKDTPAATPAATPEATPKGKGKAKGKHPATPAPTPTPTASTAPVATPPGQSALATPAPDLPAILPSKKTAASPKPVSPPPAP